MANELYTSAEYVAAILGQTNALRTSLLNSALEAACRRIDGWCGRRFSKDTTPSSRVFYPLTSAVVEIDDCYDVDTVKLDTGDSGTFGTTLATTDWQTRPLNGVGPSRGTGWPATRIDAVGSTAFPCGHARPPVQVTGSWGWAAVPEPIAQAAVQLTIMLYRSPDAPFGTAGIADIGLTRVRMPQTVVELLSDYVRDGTGGVLVA